MDDKQRLAKFQELQKKVEELCRLMNQAQMITVKREELMTELFTKVIEHLTAQMRELMPENFEEWDHEGDFHDDNHSN